jgi:hypothetical protein
MQYEYKRKKGKECTYAVTLEKYRDPAGAFRYDAKVHVDGYYKGEWLAMPIATPNATDEQAIDEAVTHVNADIEDLVGINE